MSSASSAVTYTSVYTDFEPGRVFWGVDEELSDGEPIYPDYIPLEDEHVLPAEEQPLPLVVSPTAELPEYVAESDPEEDPEEYEDYETEDGSVDYPMDGGVDDDGDSSRDDADDEDEDKEEEEHLAPADSAVVIPTDWEHLARCTAPDASPLPPPLHMPLPVDRRDDIPKTEMPPRKRLCLSTLGSRYGIRDTWVDPIETLPEIEPMTMGEQVDLLMEDKIANQETIQIVEDEAYTIREAWAHSIRLCQAVHFELQTHQEQVYAHKFQLHTYQTQLQLHSTLIQTQHQLHETHFQMQQTDIAELRETDCRRQAQIVETLRVMGDIRQEIGDMQAEFLALREQIMEPVTRQGPSTLPNNTNPNPNNMTPESVQAMIDQALLRNFTNGDGNHSSHEDNRRNVQTARPFFYADFMKCQPLNFK
uniref:Reverse transcriptase domain-containing protein n=1 Tax=Tanacetum cinerariifolium TaxID=118510 RepID=A0A699IE55_TANCI|nr:hypothetical protein [Tanacetum cinerariifolium]